MLWIRRAERNGKQANISEVKYIIPHRIEPATPRFLTGSLRQLGHRDRKSTRGNKMYQDVYWNRLSDKIFISLTNEDGFNHFLQVKLVQFSAEVYIYFNFGFSLVSRSITARRNPCKWNQTWPFTCSVCSFRSQILLNTHRHMHIILVLPHYHSAALRK